MLSGTADELRAKFMALRSGRDVADLLQIEYRTLTYYLHGVPEAERYSVFEIPKKSGGTRTILSPTLGLKLIQQNLCQVLRAVYQPKAAVHGFVVARSIVTNARMHRGKRYVLGVDLQDFFPSIHFGRVRGMFIAPPYNLSEEVAVVLAQVCCFRTRLPQGAPTSPAISNMICAKMDSQLLRLAEKHRCIYTRYADDLTFSTSVGTFPAALARIDPQTGRVEVGEQLAEVINGNSFVVNADKVRLRSRYERQEVTGVITNSATPDVQLNVDRHYIRQVRAMLHDWAVNGLEVAQQRFADRYEAKHRHPSKRPASFKQVVRGKIEFLGAVRGKADGLYLCYLRNLVTLAPEYAGALIAASAALRETARLDPAASLPLIVTEGKTDWKHLKSAFRRLKTAGRLGSLRVEFQESETPKGADALLARCQALAEIPQRQPRPIVFVFDADMKPSVLDRVGGDDHAYRSWGNGIYSLVIPVPEHRHANPQICIEFYYRDEEIMRPDSHGRRLFIGTEFLEKSGHHKEQDLVCRDATKPGHFVIVDNAVYARNQDNVALTKNQFADYVERQAEGFDFDVTPFEALFNLIDEIWRHYQSSMSDAQAMESGPPPD